MSLPRIHYQVVGPDGPGLTVEVATDGSYWIDHGRSAPRGPGRGTLVPAHRSRIELCLEALDQPRVHASPETEDESMAELTIGDGPTVRHYRIWTGELDEAPDLKALFRELEVIDG